MTTALEQLQKAEQQALFDLPEPSPAKQRAATKSARSGTFTDNMKLPVHRWFRYSAGFSAEWVQQLVRDLSPTAVLDPFAGSGTTLLAAEVAGIAAYGYESHPFVARIAGAKTNWDQDEQQLLDASKLILDGTAQHLSTELEHTPDLLGKCYTPDSLTKLLALRRSYEECVPKLKPAVGELAWLAIGTSLSSE